MGCMRCEEFRLTSKQYHKYFAELSESFTSLHVYLPPLTVLPATLYISYTPPSTSCNPLSIPHTVEQTHLSLLSCNMHRYWRWSYKLVEIHSDSVLLRIPGSSAGDSIFDAKLRWCDRRCRSCLFVCTF